MSAIPNWLSHLFVPPRSSYSEEELAKLAIQIALANVKHSRGPFGAIIADKQGEIISLGWNSVIESIDSTAHAEINCIRQAQKHLGTHDLSAAKLRLFSSCSPCIQCFGAIYWSGITKVFASATTEDAEALGFSEGPVSPELWKAARLQKGIDYVAGYCYDQFAKQPFEEYKAKAGVIY